MNFIVVELWYKISSLVSDLDTRSMEVRRRLHTPLTRGKKRTMRFRVIRDVIFIELVTFVEPAIDNRASGLSSL